MGHNIDLTEFGINNINCSECEEDLQQVLEDFDMDCDLSHEDWKFSMTLQCPECGHENQLKFKMIDITNE